MLAVIVALFFALVIGTIAYHKVYPVHLVSEPDHPNPRPDPTTTTRPPKMQWQVCGNIKEGPRSCLFTPTPYFTNK